MTIGVPCRVTTKVVKVWTVVSGVGDVDRDLHVSDSCRRLLSAGAGGAAAIIRLFVYIVIGFVYIVIGLCVLVCGVVWFVFVVVFVVGDRCTVFRVLSAVWAL